MTVKLRGKDDGDDDDAASTHDALHRSTSTDVHRWYQFALFFPFFAKKSVK